MALPALVIADILVFGFFSWDLLVAVLWMFLLAEVWLTRTGISQEEFWKEKFFIIVMSPVLAMMTAVILPFASLELLLVFIVGGVGISWVLVRVSNPIRDVKTS